jgi:membrane protein YdbS with pleckstrin-like domain
MSAAEPTQWQTVSPRYRVEAFGGALGYVLGPLVVSSLPLWVGDERIAFLSWFPLAIVGGVSLLVLAFVPRRVRALGYQLRQDDVVFRKGVLFRRQVAAPYGRLQLVDISRGPLSRLLGLSEVRIVTAAASTGMSIPGIPAPEAEELRDHLIAVAETRRAGL